MGEKYESIDIQDSLDDLERDFNNVMSNIASDDKMSKFSHQYKKLLDAFASSHKNNTSLVEKCRALNSEIVQNSTKVNSVLSLSADDQRTISGLKFEFEKAWKMVEISQQKEEKSRETIEALKFEAKKLGKLAEESGTNAFLDDNSIETIRSDIDELKKEIEIQQTQIESLSSEVGNWKQAIDKLNSDKESYSNELNSANDELTNLREQAKSVEDEVNDTMNRVQDVKNTMISNNTEISDFPKKRAASCNNLEEVKRNKEDRRLELNEVNEMKVQQQQRVNLANKLLENKQQFNNKVRRDMESVTRLIKEKDDYIRSFEESTKETVDAYNASDSDLKAMQKERSLITEDIIKTRARITQCRAEIFRLQHENIKLEGEIQYDKRSISITQHFESKAKNEMFKEKKNCEAAENATETVFIDISQAKIIKQNEAEKAQSLIQEINNLSADVSEFIANTLVSENQRIEFDEKRKELEILYNKTTNRIHRVNAMHKSLVEERDLVRRQFELLKQEAKNIENDNIVINNEIQSSKELIKQKDLDCVRVHRDSEELRMLIPDLEKKKAKEEENLKEISVLISTKYNELVRSRYYRDVSVVNVKELDLNVKSLKSAQGAHESQVNRRHEEINALRDKIKSLKWNISIEAIQYNHIKAKVEELKEELILSVKHKKRLINLTRHYDALRKECLRTEKIIMQYKVRAKALEDEIETPINVHRWRFLEGTNPEHLSLIKMVQSLRNSLMIKISQIERLKNSLACEKEEVDKAMKKANRESKEEQEIQINFYNDILQKKNAQLRIVKENIRQSSGIVTDGRESVSNVRNMLRDVKIDYFKLKQENNQIRSSSQIQTTSKLVNDLKPKFIGGGFGYSKPLSSLAESPSAPETPNPGNLSIAFRSSHIVVPNKSIKTPSPVHRLLGKKTRH